MSGGFKIVDVAKQPYLETIEEQSKKYRLNSTMNNGKIRGIK